MRLHALAARRTRRRFRRGRPRVRAHLSYPDRAPRLHRAARRAGAGGCRWPRRGVGVQQEPLHAAGAAGGLLWRGAGHDQAAQPAHRRRFRRQGLADGSAGGLSAGPRGRAAGQAGDELHGRAHGRQCAPRRAHRHQDRRAQRRHHHRHAGRPQIQRRGLRRLQAAAEPEPARRRPGGQLLPGAGHRHPQHGRLHQHHSRRPHAQPRLPADHVCGRGAVRPDRPCAGHGPGSVSTQERPA